MINEKICNLKFFWGLGIGDWGLGIGPIPNPQSPIPNPHFIIYKTRLLIKSNTEYYIR